MAGIFLHLDLRWIDPGAIATRFARRAKARSGRLGNGLRRGRLDARKEPRPVR
jgi:hypothetical protein